MRHVTKEELDKIKKAYSTAKFKRDKLAESLEIYENDEVRADYHKYHRELMQLSVELDLLMYPYEEGETFKLAGDMVKVVGYNERGTPLVSRKLKSGGWSKRRDTPRFYEFMKYLKLESDRKDEILEEWEKESREYDDQMRRKHFGDAA